MLGRLGEGCQICCAATTRLNTTSNDRIPKSSFVLSLLLQVPRLAERQVRTGGQGQSLSVLSPYCLSEAVPFCISFHSYDAPAARPAMRLPTVQALPARC